VRPDPRAWLGVRLQDWIDQMLFQRLVVAVILVSGLSLVTREFWG
jgi:uncharacterized membrane protein YfcA